MPISRFNDVPTISKSRFNDVPEAPAQIKEPTFEEKFQETQEIYQANFESLQAGNGIIAPEPEPVQTPQTDWSGINWGQIRASGKWNSANSKDKNAVRSDYYEKEIVPQTGHLDREQATRHSYSFLRQTNPDIIEPITREVKDDIGTPWRETLQGLVRLYGSMGRGTYHLATLPTRAAIALPKYIPGVSESLLAEEKREKALNAIKNREKFIQAYWDSVAEKIPIGTPTGKFAEKLTFKDLGDPGRFYQTLVRNMPIMAAFAVIYIANPLLGTSLMIASETAGILDDMDKYEERTGQTVNPVMREVIALAVGGANGMAERIGMKNVIGAVKYTKFQNKLINAVANGGIGVSIEAGTEGWQNGNSLIARSIYDVFNEFDVVEYFDQYVETALQVLPSAGILRAGSTIARGYMETVDHKKDRYSKEIKDVISTKPMQQLDYVSGKLTSAEYQWINDNYYDWIAENRPIIDGLTEGILDFDLESREVGRYLNEMFKEQSQTQEERKAKSRKERELFKLESKQDKLEGQLEIRDIEVSEAQLGLESAAKRGKERAQQKLDDKQALSDKKQQDIASVKKQIDDVKSGVVPIEPSAPITKEAPLLTGGDPDDPSRVSELAGEEAYLNKQSESPFNDMDDYIQDASNELAVNEIERVLPPPPTPPAQPVITQKLEVKPVTAKPTVTLKKEEIVRIRKDFGLAELPEFEQRKWTQVLNEANGENLVEAAETIANEVKLRPRPITDKEHAAMVIRSAKLADEYDAKLKETEALIDKGEIAEANIANSQAESILNQIDLLSEASDLAGREAARSLNIRKMQLNRQTYDIATVTRAAKAAKGGKLTAEESAEIKKRVERVSVNEKLLKTAEGRIDEFEKQELKSEAEKAVVKEGVKTKRVAKRKTQKEKRKAEREEIRKALRKLGDRFNDITGLTAEGSFLVSKLAISYIRDGVTTLDGVVEKVLNDYPKLKERDVYEALSGRLQEKRMRNETERRVTQLKTQANLLVQLEDAEKGIFKKGKKFLEGSPQVKALRNTLRKLRQEAYKSEPDPRRLERILKKISDVQDQIERQYRIVKKDRVSDPDEIKVAKQNLRDIRSLMETKDKTADLQEQLRTGEFKIKPEPVKRQLPQEITNAKVKLDIARKDVRNAVEGLKPLTVRRLAGEIITAPRALMATADMSYALRQGLLLSIRRPILATQVFAKAFNAFWSRQTAAQIDLKLREDPQHFLRQKSKLYMSPLESGSLNQREETFASNLVQRIPIWGKVVQAAERNMIVGLNLLRAGVFDEFARNFPNATDAELKAYADYVNVASGRGDLKQFSSAATTLSAIFFSPRFMVSRFQSPAKVVTYWNEKRVRNEIAKDFAAFAATGATVLTLAAMAGADVGTDPRDSDFGKILVGNTRIDIFAGFVQPARLIIRMLLAGTDRAGITGSDLPDYAKKVNVFDLVGRFGTYKLSPAITLPSTLITGRNVIQQEMNPPEALTRAVVPLFLQEAWDTYRDAGLAAGVLANNAAFVGIGVSTFEKSVASQERKLNTKIKQAKASGDKDKLKKALADKQEFVKKQFEKDRK